MLQEIRYARHTEKTVHVSSPLLCELHAHTTWSDGELSPRELCDLYGQAGFDVLAITDHTTSDGHVRPEVFARYLAEIDAEAARARALFGLLVVPGLELTCDDPDPGRAGHAVAIGLRRFVEVGAGLEPALRAARTHGAALIAAHPDTPQQVLGSVRQTAAFATEPERFAPLVDRSSSSTATRCSAGSPRRVYRRSPAATSTSAPTSTSGRRSCPARQPSAPSSTTSARRAPLTSCDSTPTAWFRRRRRHE